MCRECSSPSVHFIYHRTSSFVKTFHAQINRGEKGLDAEVAEDDELWDDSLGSGVVPMFDLQ